MYINSFTKLPVTSFTDKQVGLRPYFSKSKHFLFNLFKPDNMQNRINKGLFIKAHSFTLPDYRSDHYSLSSTSK